MQDEKPDFKNKEGNRYTSQGRAFHKYGAAIGPCIIPTNLIDLTCGHLSHCD